MGFEPEGFIVCPVLNISRATKFYTEVLGFRQMKDLSQHGWVEMEGKGGLRVALSLRRGIHRLPPGGASPALVVEDLGAANRELSAKGVRFREERMEVSDYLLGLSLWDSEGNRLYLVQLAREFQLPEAPHPEPAPPSSPSAPAPVAPVAPVAQADSKPVPTGRGTPGSIG